MTSSIPKTNHLCLIIWFQVTIPILYDFKYSYPILIIFKEIYETLISITAPGRSGPENNSSGRIRHTSQSSPLDIIPSPSSLTTFYFDNSSYPNAENTVGIIYTPPTG